MWASSGAFFRRARANWIHFRLVSTQYLLGTPHHTGGIFDHPHAGLICSVSMVILSVVYTILLASMNLVSTVSFQVSIHPKKTNFAQ